MEIIKSDKLDVRVRDYWRGRDTSSVNGLELLDECIQEFAKNRNWDPLSRFFVRSMVSGQRAKVARIISLAFGDAVSFKTDKDHPTGGRFTIKWGDGPFNLAGRNSYAGTVGRVLVGNKSLPVKDRRGWDDKAFSMEIAKLIPKKEAPKKALDNVKAAKRLADLLVKIKGEGYNVGEVLAIAQANVAGRQNDKVEKGIKVVGG